MIGQSRQLPPLPEIGHPEAYYAKQVHLADRVGDRHAHEAYKVGQYVTLALDPHLSWEEKLKYFRHALKTVLDPSNYSNQQSPGCNAPGCRWPTVSSDSGK